MFKVKTKIFLAPMHEVNDIGFRLLCKKAGAGLTYTGLINPQTKEKLYLNDKPALQFACNSKKGIKEFIKKYDGKIFLYDFNLGCPSSHAKQSKIGYFMIENTKAIEEILKEIKKYTKKPITIKIRKMPLPNLKAILKIAEKYCDALAIHPRTQIQGYAGIPDIEYAKKIKKITCLPIIYSGNINKIEEAKDYLKIFDYVMIGRASIGNPAIFSSGLKYNFMDWYNLIKKIDKKLRFNQVKFQAMNFIKGIENAKKMREKISKSKNEQELLEIIR